MYVCTGTSANEYQQRETDQASRTARVTPASMNAILSLLVQNLMTGTGAAMAGGGENGGRANGNGPHPSDVE